MSKNWIMNADKMMINIDQMTTIYINRRSKEDYLKYHVMCEDGKDCYILEKFDSEEKATKFMVGLKESLNKKGGL